MSTSPLEQFDPNLSQSKRVQDVSVPKDVALEWERRLGSEGMGSEVPIDQAAELLRAEQQETSEVRVSDEKIREAIQNYWIHRGAVTYGHHLQAAQDIGNRLGLPAGYIDDAMMKDVEEEIGQAQRLAFHTARSIIASDSFCRSYPRRLMAKLRAELGEQLSHISDDARYSIMADAVSRAAF